MAQNTGWRNACKFTNIFFLLQFNLTVGLNLCPFTGKTFSTFLPLLWFSSSAASSQGKTSRTRLPLGFSGCLIWPDLEIFFKPFFFLHLLASSIQVDATSHTTWPHSLIPQILIHLEEFKSNLSENHS